MNCEICGNQIEKPKTVLIDKTQFDVCENCVSLGKQIEVPDERTERRIHKPQNFIPKQDFSSAELIEGFGKKIMQARQKKGLTIKELAVKLYEKDSVLHRIESEKFTPSDKVIKKIENELEISLREQ